MFLTIAKGDIQLRDYQRECLDAIVARAERGAKRLLVALPTGTGKTVIFSQLPRVLPGKMLVMAHREEFLDQAAEKIEWANPELKVDVEQPHRHASPMSEVVVASIQTLAVSPKSISSMVMPTDGKCFGSTNCSRSPTPRTCTKRARELPLEKLMFAAVFSTDSRCCAARASMVIASTTVMLAGMFIRSFSRNPAVTTISSTTGGGCSS